MKTIILDSFGREDSAGKTIDDFNHNIPNDAYIDLDFAWSKS